MDKKYVLKLIGQDGKKGLLLNQDKRPFTFPTVNNGIEIAQAYREWHPELTYEVKEYLGCSSIVADIALYGLEQLAMKTEAVITTEGRVILNPPTSEEQKKLARQMQTTGIRIS